MSFKVKSKRLQSTTDTGCTTAVEAAADVLDSLG